MAEQKKESVKRTKILFKEYLRSVEKIFQDSFSVWYNKIYLQSEKVKKDDKFKNIKTVKEWDVIFKEYKNYQPK